MRGCVAASMRRCVDASMRRCVDASMRRCVGHDARSNGSSQTRRHATETLRSGARALPFAIWARHREAATRGSDDAPDMAND
ncbi:hypothetical protein WG70_10805 [Burkholderia oklahomensis EO147]|nr:hypothetical protein WG70_10805 [Burkholderia oklahomensis EO147]KUY68393.1 hypothetical protein WG70_25350 [Burkholderia oklahomensis EO147]